MQPWSPAVLLLLGLVSSVLTLHQIMGLAVADGSVLLSAATMGCLSVIWLLLVWRLSRGRESVHAPH
jgi:uncharacterized membrane protein